MKLQFSNNPLKILEAHSGLSALLVEKSDYDGIWISSLTHAASKGLPDNELVPLKERVDLTEEIRRITTKPIVVDIDTGGDIRHLPYYIQWFNRAGASAVIIEDKKYPKENSLLENGNHQLEDIDIFCEKIRIAKMASQEMSIIARLESLIARKSMNDALLRANAYREAGADAILIHSKEEISANEVMEFAKRFKETPKCNTPLVAIPTTYELPEIHPFSIVIYANQLLRASLKGMENYLEGKAELAEVEDIFKLVGH